MKILVTGAGGFIGFHLSKLLLSKKYEVFGYDNLNNYYDIKIKKDRISILSKNKKFFNFKKADLENFNTLNDFVKKNKIKIIIHLAAQAGVRYSVQNPNAYFSSNIQGFFNILEVSKLNNIKHLIFASTSSVYGDAKKFPLTEKVSTDKPQSFYAASKKTNEIMAYAYSNIYKIPITGLRFFTVYGPYGRPDMALFKFVKNIIAGDAIELYNNGNHIRDFTYIDDVIISIEKLIDKPSKKQIPYDIFNIAGGKPRNLKTFLRIIEKKLEITAKINYKKMQQGDVHKTEGNSEKIRKKIKYIPGIGIEKGITLFIDWYKNYFR